jgi:hypothetical protein
MNRLLLRIPIACWLAAFGVLLASVTHGSEARGLSGAEKAGGDGGSAAEYKIYYLPFGHFVYVEVERRKPATLKALQQARDERASEKLPIQVKVDKPLSPSERNCIHCETNPDMGNHVHQYIPTEMSGEMFNRLNSMSPPCYMDVNGDRAIDIFDVLSFVEAFEMNDPVGDWTNDQVWDYSDILAFIDDYLAGCP